MNNEVFNAVAAQMSKNGVTRLSGKTLSRISLSIAVSSALASCALPPGTNWGDSEAPMVSDVVYNNIDASLVTPEASNEEVAPVSEEGAFSKLHPKFGVTTGVVYDDNLFLDPTNPTSDVEFTISPRLSLGLGDSTLMEETYVALDYQATGHVFIENSDQNAIDHNLLIHGQYRLGKLRTKANGRFLSLSGANREIGGRIEQKAYEAAVESAWDVTGKISAGARVGIRTDLYDDNQYSDTSDRHIEAFVEYAITGKTTIGLGGRFGQIVTDNAPDQEYTQAFIQAQTRPAEKLTFTARVGVDRREIGSSMEVNPMLEASLNFKPRAGTEIQVAPFSTLNPSTLNPGESYVRTGVTASVRQKIGNRFYAKLEGGYEQGSYTSAEAGAPDREDDYWYIKPSVGYQFKENISAEIYFRHAQNSSNNAQYSYEANQIGAALNIQY